MGRWHAHYARQCGATICGVVDPYLTAAELRGSLRGAAHFQQLQPLLQALKPDVLHVCTPAKTHAEMIEHGLAAGVHLLVEKPMAPDAEITGRLLRSSENKGLLLVPVHQFAFQDGVLNAQAALPGWGKLLHFDAVFCSAGAAGLAGEQLDDLMADILPHPLSLLDRFSPGVLDEMEWASVTAGPGEWRITGSAREMSASILISLHGRPTEASLRLTGANGTVRLDLFHGFSVVEPGGVSRTLKIAHPFQLAAQTFWTAGQNLAGRLVRNAPAYPGLHRLIGLFYDAVEHRSAAPFSPCQVLQLARTRDLLCSRLRQRS